MFEFFRKPGAAKSLTTYVIFGGIIIVFVFLGDVGPLSQVGAGYAARVNHQVITVSQYREALQRTLNFYSQYLGGDFDINKQKQFGVRERVLGDLINMAAVYQEAHRLGLRATDAEIREIILNIDGFKEDGVFRREYYDRWLESQRKSAVHFEDELRQQILFEKMGDVFKSSLVSSSLEKKKEEMAQNIKLKVDYLELGDLGKVSHQEVTEYLSTDEGQQELASHYKENLSQYTKKNPVVDMKTKEPNKEEQNTLPEDVKILIAEKLLGEKKQREVKEAFNQALAAGDKKQINQLLSPYKKKWKTTKEFSIGAPSIPELGSSESVFEAVLPLKEKGQMATSLVDINGQSYLFRRNSVKTVKKKEMFSLDGTQKFNSLFGQWSEELVRVANIERNPSLFEQ